jgi:hypothetical protein
LQHTSERRTKNIYEKNQEKLHDVEKNQKKLCVLRGCVGNIFEYYQKTLFLQYI